jgi:ATP synthase protein I
MIDPGKRGEPHSRQVMAEEIARKAERKLKADRRRNKSILFGLGMLGMVGWSVAVPTLLGVAIGVWLDRSFPGQASWTLTFLLIGAGLGCVNAWSWVQRQNRQNHEKH